MANLIEIAIHASDNASSVLKGITGSLDGMGTNLIKVGGLLTAVTAPIAGILATSVQAASEAQQVFTQLEAVLKSTGGVAGVTADMANELATSLSKVTRFEDETILSAENLLLTFTRIGKDVFPDAVKAALDLSTAMGTDLNSATLLVAKALNDPLVGLTSLTRAGVQFTDAQKTMIESMVAAGDVMGAQRIILGELATQFGGSAEAAGRTFAGRMDIISNKIGNLKEKIGEVLLPILEDVVGVIDRVVDRISEWADKNPVLLRTIVLIGGALVTLGPLLIGAGTALIVVSKASAALTALNLGAKIMAIVNPVKLLGIAIGLLTSPIGLVVAAGALLATVLGVDLLGGFKAIGDQIGLFINDIGEQGLEGAFRNLFTTFEDGSSRLSTVLEGFGMGREHAQKLADDINNVVQKVVDGIGVVRAILSGDTAGGFDILKNMGLNEEAARAAMEVLDATVGSVRRAIIDIQISFGLIPFYAEYAFNKVRGFVETQIVNPLKGIWTLAEPHLNNIIEWFDTELNRAITNVSSWVQDNIVAPLQNIWTDVQPWLEPIITWFEERFREIEAILAPVFARVTSFITQLQALWALLGAIGASGATIRAPAVDTGKDFGPPGNIGPGLPRNPWQLPPNSGLFPPIQNPDGSIVGGLPRGGGGGGMGGFAALPASTAASVGIGSSTSNVNLGAGAIVIQNTSGDPEEVEQAVYRAIMRIRDNGRG